MGEIGGGSENQEERAMTLEGGEGGPKPLTKLLHTLSAKGFITAKTARRRGSSLLTTHYLGAYL